MAQNKMDFAPESAGPEAPRRIRLPARPLSPWLRLAHVTGYPAGQAGGRARLRTLLDFELVLQTEGSGWIWSAPDGGSVDVPAGSVAFIPPGFEHGWASEPGRHLAVHFDLHAHPRLEAMRHIRMREGLAARKPLAHVPRFRLGADGPVLPLVTPLRNPRLMRERLLPLVELWSRRANRSVDAQLLAASALGWALRTIADDAAQAGLGGAAGTHPRIEALLRELADPQALGARPTIDELAASAGLGRTAFRDAFTKAAGRGPREYLEAQRIERAARALLETDRKVLEIAQTEGYDDPYHFSRVFRRVTGLSPRQYRRKGRAM